MVIKSGKCKCRYTIKSSEFKKGDIYEYRCIETPKKKRYRVYPKDPNSINHYNMINPHVFDSYFEIIQDTNE